MTNQMIPHPSPETRQHDAYYPAPGSDAWIPVFSHRGKIHGPFNSGPVSPGAVMQHDFTLAGGIAALKISTSRW